MKMKVSHSNKKARKFSIYVMHDALFSQSHSHYVNKYTESHLRLCRCFFYYCCFIDDNLCPEEIFKLLIAIWQYSYPHDRLLFIYFCSNFKVAAYCACVILLLKNEANIFVSRNLIDLTISHVSLCRKQNFK